jgi:hypothetical protein
MVFPLSFVESLTALPGPRQGSYREVPKQSATQLNRVTWNHNLPLTHPSSFALITLR